MTMVLSKLRYRYQSKTFRIQCLPYKVHIASALRVQAHQSGYRTLWVVEVLGREYGRINYVILKRRPTEDSVLRVSHLPDVEGVAGGRKHAAVGTCVFLVRRRLHPN